MGKSLVRAGLTGMVVAIVLVVITYLIADAVSGPLEVTAPGQDTVDKVPLGGAVIFTIIGGVIGFALALLASRLSRGPAIFLGVCLVALVLYALPPFGAAEETSTALWLNVMHLAAAVPIVGSLYQWLLGRTDAAVDTASE